MKKFFKSFFYCTGFASLNIMMQFVATIPLTILYMVFFMVQNAHLGNTEALFTMNTEKMIRDILMPCLILAGILTFAVAWLAHVIFKRKFIERLSFSRVSIVLIVISFIAGCALQLPTSFVISVVENIGVAPDLFEQYSELIEPLMDGQNFYLQILAIGIIAPLVEEIIFRGLIFNHLKKNISVPMALIIQALLFGLSHMNVVQGTYAFVAGIIMGLSLIWSRSLLLPIALHMGMNLSGVFLSEFGEGFSDMTYTILLILSFVLVPVCMTLIGYFTRQKKTGVQENDLQAA